jgi:phospholipase/carboxylesterase
MSKNDVGGGGRLFLPPPNGDPVTLRPGRRDIVVQGHYAGVCHVPAVPPRRLVIMLHGAGGTAEGGLRLLLPYAEEHALLLYAPQSCRPTWDLIGGGYGRDADRIQSALTLFAGMIASTCVAPVIGGFSDGASYALSLGLGNGDVFDAVLAFSPGFAAPGEPVGRPDVFISHGRADAVLPIDRCGRRLARVLRATGYPVHYVEYDGGHQIPPGVADAASDWLETLGPG